jgi:tRNA 2-thiouridine synthesizing protein B
MAVLHLVNHADALPACLGRAAAEDAVLLIEDAAYAATRPTDRPLFVLDVDARARGLLARLASGVTVVDDAGFVELVVHHNPVVTWR